MFCSEYGRVDCALIIKYKNLFLKISFTQQVRSKVRKFCSCPNFGVFANNANLFSIMRIRILKVFALLVITLFLRI